MRQVSGLTYTTESVELTEYIKLVKAVKDRTELSSIWSAFLLPFSHTLFASFCSGQGKQMSYCQLLRHLRSDDDASSFSTLYEFYFCLFASYAFRKGVLRRRLVIEKAKVALSPRYLRPENWSA